MRFGLVRIVTALLVCLLPATMTAAVAQTTTSASSTASAPKAAKPAVKKAKAKKSSKAKSTKAGKYNAPVYTSIVIDVESGQVLNEHKADTKSYPASLTKMMTIYMTFEALDRGELTMDTRLKVSQRASAAAPSKLGLTPRNTIAVEDAINALITKSANDVAVVIAERLAGTEAAFAERMTAKARMLGMDSTTFHNAHGLPHPQQLSTARDMATLAIRLMKDFPEHYHLFSQMDFTYQGQTIRTHNRLLEFYEGADGLKTGYTAASGFNLAASAVRNGRRIVGVVFGGKSAPSRDRQLASLMDNGFAHMAGQPETLIANAPDAGNYQIATAHLSEDAAEAAGDTDQDYPFRRSTVTTTTLPPIGAAPALIQEQAVAALPAPVPAQAPKAEEPPATIAALIPKAEAGLIRRAAAATPKMPVSKASNPESWGIQVGAFSSRATAEDKAMLAAGKLRSAYAGAEALVQPVKVKGKTVYRARVMGLDQDELIKACSLVKVQANSACQAIRPDAG